MMSPTPIQTQLSISPTSSLTHQVGGLLNAFKGGNGLMLLIVLVGWFLLARFSNHHKKNRLATARFAGVAEKRAAKRKAMGLMKARKHNEVAFKIYKSLDLPNAERGIAVSGGAGSGKTASMILPIAYSAIEQGFPLYTYDFKYLEPNDSLVSAIAPIALKAGYQVHIFAPGMPESEICNPLDFIEDDLDVPGDSKFVQSASTHSIL